VRRSHYLQVQVIGKRREPGGEFRRHKKDSVGKSRNSAWLTILQSFREEGRPLENYTAHHAKETTEE